MKLRMINEVLLEARKVEAPTKRRKTKAKRAIKKPNIGNIKDYFSSLYQPKESSSNKGKEGGAGAELRKRKLNECMETTLGPRDPKSRRTLVEDTVLSENEDSRTLCPFYLGAKSWAGKEPTDRRRERAGIIGINGGISHGDEKDGQGQNI